MFGSVLNKLLGKSGGAASRLASEYGDDVLRSAATEYGDDAARSVLSSLGDAVSSGAKKSKIGDALVRASDTGLNAPLSLSKKDMRDIGSGTSERIGKLFDRTGMSNVEDLRSFAKELTGNKGSRAYLDEATDAVRSNLGHGNNVDLSDLGPQIREVRDSMSPMAARIFDEADPIKKANILRGMASDIGKAATENKEKSIIKEQLNNLGRAIDERIDAGVNPKYINEMYDNVSEEFLHRSQEAFQKGDKSKAEAYKRLAKEYADTPVEERTIGNFRSSKSDFVDLSKMLERNDQTKGGGSFSRAVNQLPVVGPAVDALLSQPVERGAQKAGEIMRKVGREFQAGTAQEKLKKAAAVGAGGVGLLAAASGGNDKNKKTGDMLDESDPTGNTANMMGSTQTGSTNKMAGLGDGVAGVGGETTIGGYTRSQLEDAYVKALMANDPKSAQAIGSIIDMADKKEARAISAAKTGKNSATSKADAKKEAGLNTLNTLLKTYEKGGGGQGVIGGTLTNLLNTATGGNWNPSAQTYAAQSRGAAAQIIKALGESGQLSDRDMQSAMDMLPKNTDSDKVAKEKISNLMELLNNG
jgi:hypothetical protein|nr:MAG TPA: hypothetical protein [Caudoviricetes sp.]